ncbi:putative bifunctional diguanylate cyclase/phosphodiesterase [Larsenimonas suaedae]|uniref:EAL domain-containing protein n=1 Tax=Larsenimonas suaedae TaxID=1851019 RepID=A0ABU1GX99_9GAMM|nr:EAL domain-containing protein [Larsenimonas suaedae]MCM2973288.1 EAL domain-containing protein [Larsenimonas suaedae]MDR5896181.1 EAL domain-containing protein [Larsenimonas suaedae]
MGYFAATYNISLVVLSFAVAGLASLTALDLAGRVRVTTGRASLVWLGGGAFAMGTGIWAMHFIGMLAMDTAEYAGYNLALTAVSLGAAILTSALALFIVQTGQLNRFRLIAGSMVMGVGICLMHYVGMMAMITTEAIAYRPGLFLLSAAIAVSASGVALWLSFYLSPATGRAPLWQRLSAAMVMAVGISGMHYTGMAAAIMPNSIMAHVQSGITPVELAITTAVIATCILLAALMMAIYDAHLGSRNARLAASLHQANLDLKDRVHRDPLTHLPNRILFEERLDAQLPVADGLAVLFINLDRFRAINDTFGHRLGDAVLRAVANRLQNAVGAHDTVARGGGDEFMVLVSGSTDLDTYQTLAQQLVGALSRPFHIEDHLISLSASIGLSLYPDQAADRHALMIYADTAMSSASASGGNRFQLYEPAMSSQAERHSAIERRLRLALTTDGLSLAYQPKVNLRSGLIEGVEALLRWEDDELGRVTPDEIIPVAEATGLIVPLGQWVLRTACQCFGTDAPFERPLSVAVNVSALQLDDRQFTRKLTRILEETGFPAERLELELTESALVHNPEHARVTLTELRALGLTFAIDDFGTGYSNLAQLRRLPIQTLKIDRTFMMGVTTSAQEAAIVKAVMALAHALELHVVAEGIETPAQLDFIRELGGHHYQGYLCSKPLDRSGLLAFMKALPGTTEHRRVTSTRRV